MKDKIFMILLGIIAVNLTIQTVKDVDLFPTAYAQTEQSSEDVHQVEICSVTFGNQGRLVTCEDIVDAPSGLDALAVYQPKSN